MKRLILNTILILAGSLVLFGQYPYEEIEEKLRYQFDRLTTVKDDHKRLVLNDSIRRIIENYAVSDSVFSHKFTGIRYLGEIISTDSTIKMITWNLILADYTGRYFCYLIRKSDGKNMVFPLEASYSKIPVDTDSIFSNTSWYGALYYDLRPVSFEGEKCWIVLGLDYGNPEITRKIIDVLSFNEKGLPLFGKKWFESPDGLNHRVVFEYSASAMMTLRFSSDTSVVFDHLVPISPELTGKRQFYGPDYSYDAYVFNGGLWKFALNVDVRNQD